MLRPGASRAPKGIQASKGSARWPPTPTPTTRTPRSAPWPARCSRTRPKRRAQDHGFDGLDSVERSLQTIEDYLRTLEGYLPSTDTEPAIEGFKGFKRALHAAETVILKEHEASAAPAPPPSPEKAKDELGDLLKVAVDEVMAEA